MVDRTEPRAGEPSSEPVVDVRIVRTFLIADVRGYSTFTRERGDVAAAVLAKRFADLARDAVEARNGRVLELRGDEAFAVFDDPAQAVRAAVELQATFGEESLADPAFQFPVGIGIDAGEAVPVEDGYRGVAVNLAARLCSSAAAGQVLVTRTVTDRSGDVADLVFAERGRSAFKGFDEPIEVIEALAVARPRPSTATVADEPSPGAEALDPELDPLTPLVDREAEMRWLRGTWRQAARGHGRALFVSGPAQIGKTRLVAEIAAYVHGRGARVRYAGPGGAATAVALAAVKDVSAATTPTMLVIDDLDVAGASVAAALAASFDDVAARPVLVLGVVRDLAASPVLAALIERADVRGDGHRALAPLDADGVRGIVQLYTGGDVTDAPVESMARASQGVPGRVHEVASDWARSEAARRLTAAAEFLSAGRDRHASDLAFANNAIALKLGSLYTVGGRDVHTEAICPYKGLAQFERADAAYFFGRERLVGELAARTVQVGVLGVVGASGSGKSSAVAAGLMPSLRAGLLPGSERWRHVAMRPGEHPMAELQRALGTDRAGPLAAMIADVEPDDGLVLVVDQFEETFTMCADENERLAFVDALASAAGSPERVVVVLAIRGDQYARLALYPSLAEHVAANHILVGSMTRDELRRSIELPARRAGLRVESTLVDALVEEVADEPGGLPLLSTALVELWGAREGGWIRREAYERTGGVRGAVSRLAEASYGALAVSEQEAAHRLFLRLAVSDEGEGISRRRVGLDELELTRDAAVAAVVDRFTRDRLLTVAHESVEVAHEALLREWPRSVAWLEADQQDRQLRQQVIQTAKRWQDEHREPSELFRGARLSAALDWSSGHGAELNELERAFLSASRQASEQDAERQRRTNRRLRGLLVGVALFLVVAIIAGTVAIAQRGSARRSASDAEHSATVALAQSLGARATNEPHLDLAMLLAREAVALDPSFQTESDLLSTLNRAPSVIRTFQGTTHRINGMALSPDGKLVALKDNQGQFLVEDTRSGAVVSSADHWRFLEFSPDDLLVETQRGHGGVAAIRFADPRTLTVSRTIAIPSRYTKDTGSGRIAIAFDAAGDHMAIGLPAGHGTSDGSIIQLSYPSGKVDGPAIRVPSMRKPSPTYTDGNHDLVVMGSRTDVMSTRTGRLIRTIPIATRNEATAIATRGMTAAIGGPDGSVRFLDLKTGALRLGIGAHTGPVQTLVFTPDGQTLASGGDDGKIFLWNVANRTIEQTLAGHAAKVFNLQVSADGTSLYSSSFDDKVLEWDLTGLHGFGATFPAAPMNPAWATYSEAVSPDSSTLAVGGDDGRVHLWSVATDREIGSFKALPGIVNAVSYTADGTLLVTGVSRNFGTPQVHSYVRLWRITPRPTLVRSMHPEISFVTWGTVSHDGSLVAASGYHVAPDGSATAEVAEWNAATGRPVAAPTHTPAPVIDLSLAPDDALAVAGYLGAEVLDPRTQAVVHAVVPPQSIISSVAYSPDGSTIASVDEDGFLRFSDAATGQLEGQPLAISQVGLNSVAWSPDGLTVVTSDWAGNVRLTDVASGLEIGAPFEVPEPDAPFPGQRYGFTQNWLTAFTPNGDDVVVSDDTGRAWVFPVTLGVWEQRACQVANRNFTQAEWARYVPEVPFQDVCPAEPSPTGG